MQVASSGQLLSAYNFSSGAILKKNTVSSGLGNTVSAIAVNQATGSVYGVYGGNEGNSTFVQYSTSTLAPTTLIEFPSSWAPAVIGGQSGHYFIANGTFVVFMRESSASNAHSLVVTINLETLSWTWFDTGSTDILWEVAVDPTNGTLIGSLNGDTQLASVFCGILGCQVRRQSMYPT